MASCISDAIPQVNIKTSIIDTIINTRIALVLLVKLVLLFTNFINGSINNEMINAIKDLFKTNLDSDITDQDKAYTLIRKINTMKLENYPDLVDKFIEVLKEYDNKEDK